MSLVWWRRNFPVLAEQFHVIAADTRGCGRSDKPAWGHRTARYAKDVYDIIEQLGLHDVTLVGWSIGARTCYSYLELFGKHRLRGVVWSTRPSPMKSTRRRLRARSSNQVRAPRPTRGVPCARWCRRAIPPRSPTRIWNG